MSINPSAPSEDDSEYNGFLSYAAEWHAASIGAGVGITAGLLYGTEFYLVGLVPFVSVILASIGNKAAAKKLSGDVVKHLEKESWYGIGFAVAFFIIGLLTQVLF